MEQNAPTVLGKEPIGKLLIQYSIPAIIAMTASSLYNMIDSIFIGHGVGPLAISGLALTFPLMNLSAAFGSLVGVGASTLISVKLGQKDYDTAQKVLGNVIVLNVIVGVAFMVVMYAFLDEILKVFGASPETLGYAKDFMEVILAGNVVTHSYLGLNAVLRASGHPREAMLATIFTVVVNAILAPIFIFVFGWGIRGAATATVIAQVMALCWQFHILLDKRELIHIRRGIFKLKRKIVVNSVSIGMAPFLMNLASCFIVILINLGLKHHGGDLAIGAYGIVNRIAFLFVMVVLGLNQGMQPIAGYNYGARQFDRVVEVLKKTIFLATCVTTTGFLISELIPAHRLDVLPHRGIPDGHVQLLPMHRDGKEGDFPVRHAPVPIPHPVPHHPSDVLGAGRGVVQYADMRCHREHPRLHHAGTGDKEVQAGRSQGHDMRRAVPGLIPGTARLDSSEAYA